MARPTGNNSIDASSRNRLVQPVLPALPLLPKAKKEAPKVEKEDGQAVVNGTAPAVQSLVESTVDLPSGTPTVESASHLEEVETSANGMELTAHPEREVETQLDADVDDNLPIHVAEKESPFDETLIQTTFAENAGEPSEQHNPEHEATPLTESKPPQSTSGVGDEFQNSSPNIGDLDNEVKPPPRFELEATTLFHDVVNRTIAEHSNNPSISNSSIQQTPLLATASPITPEIAERLQREEVGNGDSHSPLRTTVNGHSTPARQSLLSITTRPTTEELPRYPTVLDHIRQIQFAPDWFDCELCVYYPYSSKPFIYRNAHSLVLIRSDRLRNFIYPQRANSYTYYVINLYPCREISVNAFDAALRFLYADTILSGERLFPAGTLNGKPAKAGALDYVMSYMVAGLELGLEPVVTRSLDLVGRLLDWDIAELALKEAIRLRSSVVSAVPPQVPSDSLPAAKSILQHIFNLIVLQINRDQFKLDAVSTPTDLTPRFAMLEAGRAVINPALANIAFGSMPASTNISPTSPQYEMPVQVAPSSDTIISNIMLNLDFEDFCRLAGELQEVHGAHGVRIVGEVIEERERRRLNIFYNRTISNKQRLADPIQWDVVGWREYLVDNMIQRERVGFTLPHKKGGNN